MINFSLHQLKNAADGKGPEDMFWTPLAASGRKELEFLSVYAQYDERHDRLTLDDHFRCWYRRGMPMFRTRKECIEFISAKGWRHA